MLGNIIGDIVGSRHESSPKYPKKPVQNKNFRLFTPQCRFTDDTVLTCATADAILNHPTHFFGYRIPSPIKFEKSYLKWGTNYPDRGYGSGFKKWLADSEKELKINNSYANGAMMRCSPIGMYYSDCKLEIALKKAEESIAYTHNSPESIRGVKSIVTAIHMAKNGNHKIDIKEYIEEHYGHMLNITLDEARKQPKTTIRCNVTAPQALVAFMESTDYESAIRNAIYIGGDTDTNAAIAGSIAEAYYGTDSIPANLVEQACSYLPEEITVLIKKFYDKINEIRK